MALSHANSPAQALCIRIIDTATCAVGKARQMYYITQLRKAHWYCSMISTNTTSKRVWREVQVQTIACHHQGDAAFSHCDLTPLAPQLILCYLLYGKSYVNFITQDISKLTFSSWEGLLDGHLWFAYRKLKPASSSNQMHEIPARLPLTCHILELHSCKYNLIIMQHKLFFPQ